MRRNTAILAAILGLGLDPEFIRNILEAASQSLPTNHLPIKGEVPNSMSVRRFLKDGVIHRLWILQQVASDFNESEVLKKHGDSYTKEKVLFEGPDKVTIKTVTRESFKPKFHPSGTLWFRTKITYQNISRDVKGQVRFNWASQINSGKAKYFPQSFTGAQMWWWRAEEKYVFEQVLSDWVGGPSHKSYKLFKLPNVRTDLNNEAYDLILPFSPKFRHANVDDMRERCVALFGKRRTNKPLMKALDNALADGALAHVRMAYILRTVLSVKDIISILEAPALHRAFAYNGDRPWVKKLLAQVSPGRRSRLVLNVEGYQHFDDISYLMPHEGEELLEETRERIWESRSWTEIHNALVTDYNIRQEHKIIERPKDMIPQVFYKGLEDVEIEDIRIISPKSTHDMANWGISMKHCIGSYGYYAMRGVSTYFGVMKDGGMVANVQIQDGRVIQFYGKYNSAVSSEIVRPALVAFYHYNLITEDGFHNAVERWDRGSIQSEHAPVVLGDPVVPGPEEPIAPRPLVVEWDLIQRDHFVRAGGREEFDNYEYIQVPAQNDYEQPF